MLLRKPFFVDNLRADQPYNSMLLVAPYCNNQCVGCHNQHLKSSELEDFEPEYLSYLYDNNPFWDGITLAGLEPEHSDDIWWSDVFSFVEMSNIKNVTVYTSTHIVRVFPNCVKNLYYKTGLYIQGISEKKVSLGSWEIILASNNQDFRKVLTVEKRCSIL